MEIPKTKFGCSDLEVTRLCLGCAPLGSMPEAFGFSVSEEQALSALRHLLQSPVRFLDTASVYGLSEYRIGRAAGQLGGWSDDFIVATKADRNLETGDFSADQVARSVEQSLKLLKKDRLPIVYLHDPDYSRFTFEQIMAIDGPVSKLHKLKEERIIDHIGISGGHIGMLIKYIETGAFEAVITHNRYNLLYRVAEPLIAKAYNKGLAVVNAAPFAGGILADPKINKVCYQEASADLQTRLHKIQVCCLKYDVPLKAAAFQFSLQDARITALVAGAVTPEQIDENIALYNYFVPQELWDELDQYAIYDKDPEK